MPFNVVFHRAADQEFADGFSWYQMQLDGLGDRFTDAVHAVLSQIRSNPLMYAQRKNSFRAAKVKDFPFLVVYRISDKNRIIVIASIFHTSRAPHKKYRI
ncbi:type II toxin-antitoxin system RelE/ParE family toxin [Chryseolinea lacunae]|uniref:Type II toxin-antitoxin system RelE/ParE family toxin n=1 Tax=Chryseolinea lacunae TaxID=2801331 RepID=A0ABS1KYZ9_9BACT|nr:type II toxin-antitoxin system RelE/ParE family toxin [Chryseolinea lacunae]